MIRNNNQQNGRRRGRGGGQGGGGGMPQRAPGSQNFGNNRLDIRQRGNATQLLEKYKTLARDAAQQGDRVASEYYLQYADHYFRVLNEIRERQPEHQRGPRPGYDADEDGDDVGNGYNPAYASSNEQASQEGEREDANGQRYDERGDDRQRGYEGRQDGRRDENRQPDGRQPENRYQDGRRDEGRQQEGRQQEGRQDGRQQEPRRDENRQQEGRQRDANRQGEGRRDEFRRERGERNGNAAPRPDYREARDEDAQPEVEVRRELPPVVESEEQPMMAGLPGPATLAPEAAATEEAPKRRRGRPRKVVEDSATDPVDA